MALGKHLFSFRTQKLSPAAAIILRKRETSTVPNCRNALRKEGFSFGKIYVSMSGTIKGGVRVTEKSIAINVY